MGGICHYLHSAATMVVRHTAAPGHPDKLHWTVHNSGATPALPQGWGSQDVRIQSGNQAADLPFRTGTGQRVGREMVLIGGGGGSEIR